MEIIRFVLSIALILILFKAIILTVICLRLRGQRFRLVSSRLVEPHEVPPELAPVYAAGARALQELGFVYSHTLFREPIETKSKAVTKQVFLHGPTQTWAEIFPAQIPSLSRPFGLSFATFYPDGTISLTLDTKDTLSLYKLVGIRLTDDLFTDTAPQWRAHQAALPSGQAPEILTPELFVAQADRLLQLEVQTGQAKRFLAHDAKLNEWRFTIMGALRGALVGMAESGRIARRAAHQPAMSAAPADREARVAADLVTFEKISKPRTGGTTLRKKSLILLLSGAAFIVAGGFMWSWSFLPAILIVILIHELGHLAGMKFFGYKNNSVFFIPFFGAAAVGQKTGQVRTYQEIIVYLLGPVPGMVLGFACYFLAAHIPYSFLSVLAWMFIVVNFINLLPLSPMDGGRVVELLFLSRVPRIKFVFLLLSALAFLAAYLGTRDIVLLVVAVSLGAGLPMQWRAGGLVAQCRRRLPDGADDPQRQRVIFEVLNESGLAGLAPTKRYALALILLGQLRCDTPRLTTRLVGGFAYAASLLLPLVAIAAYAISTVGFDNLSLALNYSDEKAFQNIEKRLAAAHTDRERWSVYMQLGGWSRMHGSNESARTYYAQALALAESAQDDETGDLYGASLVAYANLATNAADARHLYEEALARAEREQPAKRAAQIYLWQAMAKSDVLALSPEEQIPLLERAVAICREQRKTDEEVPMESILELATAHERAGHLDDAEKHLREYSTQIDATLYGQSLLAEFMERHDRIDDALNLLAQATDQPAMETRDAVLLSELDTQEGWLRVARSDWTNAQRCFERARTRRPENEYKESFYLGIPNSLDLCSLALLRQDEPAAQAEFDSLLSQIKANKVYNYDKPTTILADMIKQGDFDERNAPWRSRRSEAHAAVARKFLANI